MVGALGFLLLALVDPLPADTFVVTKTEDDNGACTPDDCSVREAVIAAVANPGNDRIEIPAGIHVLTITGYAGENQSMTGDLDAFSNNLDLFDFVGDSEGGTVIVGAADSRVIETQGATVRFSNIVLTGGNMGFTSRGSSGGCVAVATGSTTFIDSTISHCRSRVWGGGLVAHIAELTLINVTIHSNVAEDRGGGIYHWGIYPQDRLTIINSTISANKGLFGGGLFKASDGETFISYSTIADNEAVIHGPKSTTTAAPR